MIFNASWSNTLQCPVFNIVVPSLYFSLLKLLLTQHYPVFPMSRVEITCNSLETRNSFRSISTINNQTMRYASSFENNCLYFGFFFGFRVVRHGDFDLLYMENEKENILYSIKMPNQYVWRVERCVLAYGVVSIHCV